MLILRKWLQIKMVFKKLLWKKESYKIQNLMMIFLIIFKLKETEVLNLNNVTRILIKIFIKMIYMCQINKKLIKHKISLI